jgi:hypothetical protein
MGLEGDPRLVHVAQQRWSRHGRSAPTHCIDGHHSWRRTLTPIVIVAGEPEALAEAAGQRVPVKVVVMPTRPGKAATDSAKTTNGDKDEATRTWRSGSGY